MQSAHKRTIATFVSIPALALGGVGLATAAKDSGSSGSSGPGGSGSGPPGMSGGTMPGQLTGATATKAEAAALAAVPGTVLFAHKAFAGRAGAYDVHVRAKSGGVYEVTEDANFRVLSTRKDTRGPIGGSGGPPTGAPGGSGAPPSGTQSQPPPQGSGSGASLP